MTADRKNFKFCQNGPPKIGLIATVSMCKMKCCRAWNHSFLTPGFRIFKEISFDIHGVVHRSDVTGMITSKMTLFHFRLVNQVKSDHITGALNGRWIQAHGPCPHKPYVNLLRSKATFEWLRVPENPDCSLQHF